MWEIESIFGEPNSKAVALANCGFAQAGTCQGPKGCSAKKLEIGSGGRNARGVWEALLRGSLTVSRSANHQAPEAWSLFDRGVSESTVLSIESAGMSVLRVSLGLTWQAEPSAHLMELRDASCGGLPGSQVVAVRPRVSKPSAQGSTD